MTSNETRVTIQTPAEVVANSEFDVTVQITNVSDLNAASYTVKFSPQVVTLVSVESGTIGESSVPVDLFHESPPGSVNLSQSLAGLSSASGDGFLARLRFRFIGDAGSVSDINVTDGVLANTDAEAIPTVWTDGSVHGISEN